MIFFFFLNTEIGILFKHKEKYLNIDNHQRSDIGHVMQFNSTWRCVQIYVYHAGAFRGLPIGRI